MILGLDVSTSKVGLCIMDYKFNLLETKFIKLKDLENIVTKKQVINPHEKFWK